MRAPTYTRRLGAACWVLAALVLAPAPAPAAAAWGGGEVWPLAGSATGTHSTWAAAGAALPGGAATTTGWPCAMATPARLFLSDTTLRSLGPGCSRSSDTNRPEPQRSEALRGAAGAAAWARKVAHAHQRWQV